MLWRPEGGASARLVAGVAPEIAGDRLAHFRWASVTKLLTAYGCLIAVEEGIVRLTDEVVSLEGVTLAHLLSHAGGIAFDEPTPVAAPGTQRLYSNASFRIAAAHVERNAGMAFSEYLRGGVLEPLGMGSVEWSDPAAGAAGTIDHLATFAAELMSPTLLGAETVQDATRAWWPELDGFVPGFGMQRPCPWGLGFEIKGSKQPHWTGSTNSAQTFGHFGQSGAMLAIDPLRGEAGAGWCSLSPDPFGPWAKRAWPNMIDAP